MNIQRNQTRSPASAIPVLLLLSCAVVLAACSSVRPEAVSRISSDTSCCCAQPLDNPYFADDETLALCADELVAQERTLGANLGMHAETRVSDPLSRPTPCFS